MIKKLQILLLVFVAVVLLAFLYRLQPSRNKAKEQPGTSEVGLAGATPESLSDADFAKHVEQLKKKLPSADFVVVIQPPFVVIGDESPAAVKAHSEKTV